MEETDTYGWLNSDCDIDHQLLNEDEIVELSNETPWTENDNKKYDDEDTDFNAGEFDDIICIYFQICIMFLFCYGT